MNENITNNAAMNNTLDSQDDIYIYAYYITLPVKSSERLIGYVPDKFCILFSEAQLTSRAQIISTLNYYLNKHYNLNNCTYRELYEKHNIYTTVLNPITYPFFTGVRGIGVFSNEVISNFNRDYDTIIPYENKEYYNMLKIFSKSYTNKNSNISQSLIAHNAMLSNYNVYIVPVTYENKADIENNVTMKGYFFVYGKNHTHIPSLLRQRIITNQLEKDLISSSYNAIFKNIKIQVTDSIDVIEDVNLIKPLYENKLISEDDLYDAVQDILNHHIEIK